MDAQVLMLELESTGCAAEALLAGFPVARTSPESGRHEMLPVEHLTPVSPFDLSLVIQPGPSPSRNIVPVHTRLEGQTIGDWSVRATLSRWPLGALPGVQDGEVLAEVRWAPPPDGLIEFPHVATRRLEPSPRAGRPPWSWEALPQLPLNGETARDLARWLDGLATALSNRDADPLIQAASVRYQENAVAYRRDANREQDRTRELMRVRTNYPTFRFESVDPQRNFEPRSIAGGRLIECIGPDFEPTLRATALPSGAAGLKFPLRVAKDSQGWTIHR
jgi:hypothetical protein